MALIRLGPIIEAGQHSVGLVSFKLSQSGRGAIPQVPLTLTCALIRFDRLGSQEKVYCLLTRVPDMEMLSAPAAQMPVGGLGPLGDPQAALSVSAAMGTLSLDRNPSYARDQAAEAAAAAAAHRPEGHWSQRYILERDPVVAQLADASYEFACGTRFVGLDIVAPWHDPGYGSALLELSSACVRSLESKDLMFLPIRADIDFRAAISSAEEFSLLQYASGELCFARGPLTRIASDGYWLSYRIACAPDSGGAPLLDSENRVVSVHLGRDPWAEDEGADKGGQTVRSIVGHFASERRRYVREDEGFLPDRGAGDSTQNHAHTSGDHHNPRKLGVEELERKFHESQRSNSLTDEKPAQVTQQQQPPPPPADAELWESFKNLISKLENAASKLDSPTLESATVSSSASGDLEKSKSPEGANLLRDSAVAGVGAAANPKPRIQCLAEVAGAAESTRRIVLKCSESLEKLGASGILNARVGSREELDRKKMEYLDLLTSLGRIENDANLLASNPRLFLPDTQASRSTATYTVTSTTKPNSDSRQAVQTYVNGLTFSIRTAYASGNNSFDELSRAISNASIALWNFLVSQRRHKNT